jgi:uncharacterized protein (DUF58 family)
VPNLSPTSYLLLALIALVGIAGLWSTDAYPWWRLALVAYLVGLTYEWVRVRSARIAVAPAEQPRLRLGQPLTVGLNFFNGEPYPMTIRFAPDLPQALECSRAGWELLMGAGETRLVEVPVRPIGLGTYACNRVAATLSGPLHLAAWPRTLAMDAAIEVVPDMLAASERSLAGRPAGAAASRRVGGGMELDHLREYRPGDPRHTIDWKATARSGDLVTRVFGEDQHLEIMLVLDAGRTSRTSIDGLSQLGHYVNFAARFAEHAVANEDRIGLVVAGERPLAQLAPARGQRAVVRIRAELATLEPRAVESDLLAAAAALSSLVRHRALIVVLTDLEGAATGGRLMHSLRLWAPRHLAVVVGMVGAELGELAVRPARNWRDPFTSLAAGVYRENLDRSVQAVNRIGARALVARPRDLEARVIAQYLTLRAQRRV